LGDFSDIILELDETTAVLRTETTLLFAQGHIIVTLEKPKAKSLML
jgi:hypothetical protein